MSSGRLRLETLSDEHAPMLFDALDDARVGRFIGGPDVTTLDALRDRIRRVSSGPPAGSGQAWLNFAVLRGPSVIGRVEATVHDGLAEIAYLIGPRHWAQGYGAEAAHLLISRLANDGVHDLWATVHAENHASVRLLQSLGFMETTPPSGRALLSYDYGDRVFHRHGSAADGLPGTP